MFKKRGTGPRKNHKHLGLEYVTIQTEEAK